MGHRIAQSFSSFLLLVSLGAYGQTPSDLPSIKLSPSVRSTAIEYDATIAYAQVQQDLRLRRDVVVWQIRGAATQDASKSLFQWGDVVLAKAEHLRSAPPPSTPVSTQDSHLETASSKTLISEQTLWVLRRHTTKPEQRFTLIGLARYLSSVDGFQRFEIGQSRQEVEAGDYLVFPEDFMP